MSIDILIINFKKAIRESKPKSYVQYKFTEYLREYNSKEKDKLDEQIHRNLKNDYFRYMSSGRKE